MTDEQPDNELRNSAESLQNEAFTIIFWAIGCSFFENVNLNT